MPKVLVRFPNESTPVEMNIDLNEFKAEKEFEYETFGWYDNTYIAIQKTNYGKEKIKLLRKNGQHVFQSSW